ncbi:MAG: hypothetical protein II411_01135 [Lachnospiraceae bacterium]|nr:hypothetical protein [Lachnospiraceae bacterium]
MNLKSFKKFISVFIVSIIILSFLLPDLLVGEIVAATVGTSAETTKKKPVGHKVPGAQYYEELLGKFSVIAVDEGGANGQGGGAGDKKANNAGNSGTYDDAGGVLGGAAGQGIGKGAEQNKSGVSSSTSGFGTGSSIADALRKLREVIDESRAESLAKVIESAIIASSVAQSAEYSENELKSMIISHQKESIKAQFNPVVQTRQIPVSEGIVAPKVVEVVETKSIVPTAAETERKETTKISDFEPGDFIEETTTRQRLTLTTNEIIDRPTTAKTEYDEVSTAYSETYEVFDFPIVEEETQPLTEELSSEVSDYNETEPVVEAEEKKEESSAVVEDDEGSGSKGGKDPEAYEDKRGDEAENESKGQALEKGQLRSESEGEYAGFKVFELETNGKIGFNPDSLAVTNIRGVMIASSILLLSLGALTFIFSTFDLNKKNNYF